MRNTKLIIIISFLFVFNLSSQNTGDTIVVQTFDYGMTYGQAWGPPRDTIAHFPNNPNLTFEKIIMSYSMRCKNGQVNTSGGNNVACGEWDYSCHTYIHDSTRIDSILNKVSSHEINNFSGSVFNFTSNPVYNYYYTYDTLLGLYLDSVILPADTILEFGIISNPGTLMNDLIDTISTNIVWSTPYSYTYDTSGSIINIDTILISETINILELSYYKRYPMAFQIMSFVTPYGIGLDLGPEGKTWYFDLTDYAPVFKGPKRITVSGGGQWQEDMDIKFLFIVGTPTRDIINTQQIWRPQSKGYNSILNNSFFEPRSVNLNPNASAYKIKTVVTGHGQEGEFVPRNHYINIDNSAPYTDLWQVWTECSENPVYPQGGTWLADRAGWCPGQASDVRELDITNIVTPGQNHTIDYGVTTASGTSNYWVSSQLISYGPPNHNLDASVTNIISPSDNVLYSRKNPICTKPKITIQNTGSTPLTSLIIEYWINDAINKEVFEWTGNLNFLETEEVELPANKSLWDNIDFSGGKAMGEVVTYENNSKINKFYVEIKNPNASNDEYLFNNLISSTFSPAPKYPAKFTLWASTNTNNGLQTGICETSWKINDTQGNAIYSWINLPAGQSFSDTVNLSPGCYSLDIIDSDQDGMDYWANNDGAGALKLRRINAYVDTNATPWTYHTWFKDFELDFGSFIHHEFVVGDYGLNIGSNKNMSFDIFPNPSYNNLTIRGTFLEKGKIIIYDNLGRSIYSKKYNHGIQNITIDMSSFSKGLYFIKLKSKTSQKIEKIIKQ
ncbi:MAG: hypothetical protein CMD05_02690 [Flavobacteriales bacterium]|nr:hypothetical protein [Flavobacteriales bacterium]|tara:strand:+ start:1294 stop:3648 length:2355 start_codon:yes stop_codon:yes gene_type:complete